MTTGRINQVSKHDSVQGTFFMKGMYMNY